jgi:pseudouridine kinase
MINGQSQSERERPECMNSGTGRLICIGGATVDWTYRTKDAVHLRTSNPATSERSFGGVARNVAENVARLGAHSSLVSMLGGDENGRAIRESLDRLDIDTRHIGISADHATAEYVAVLQPNGDLVLGLADMAIFDALSPTLLKQVWPDVSASWIFADCNLPAQTVHELVDLARRHSTMVAIDAVSVLKVMRLPRDLNGIGILFLNLDEARAFLSRSSILPDEAAGTLLDCGAARVILTLGEGGLIAADRSGLTRLGAMTVQVVDATGAGDALIAGTLVALMNGSSLADAARMGTAAAALTLESAGSVRPDLSLSLLRSALERSSNQPFERGIS